MMRASCKPSPEKLKRKREAFVKVPIWWAGQAFKAARIPKALVCLWLLHLSWKKGTKTFALPNGELRKMGVGRDTKYHTLAALEQAGLIKVERRGKKTLAVTLLY